MRIKLTLRPLSHRVRIPINYQYPLSAAIYKTLRLAAPDYAAFLHERGYPAASGRAMKLFTFSLLRNHTARLEKSSDGATLVSTGRAWCLQIGSPMHEAFVQHFVLGLFESSELVIGGRGWRVAFRVEQVETVACPTLSVQMRFRCLSPFSVSRPGEQNGKLVPKYLTPHDEELPQRLRDNILEKYGIIHGCLPTDRSFLLRFEKSDRPRTKLMTLKEGTPQETKRRAIEGHFTLEGNPELIRAAWECGLGEANSMGFGMVGVISGARNQPFAG